MEKTKTYNLGNNEEVKVGVIKQANGTFLAMTFTRSKYFKTEKAALKWLNPTIQGKKCKRS